MSIRVLVLAAVAVVPLLLGLGPACGGATTTLPGGSDASADGRGSSSGGGSTSGSSSGGSSSGGSSSGGSGSGASSGGGSCSPACGPSRLCCNGTCVNPDNDPFNCGACGVQCTGSTPFCSGSCQPAQCSANHGCDIGLECCGDQCCVAGDLCCQDEGPISRGPSCFHPTPSQPTCPQGCAPLCVSDRNAKRDIEAVDEQAVLEGVARMPISTWSYSSDERGVRHLGPMAQDFHAAFGLGDTDRAYDPVDAHGVTFAAIQALYARVQEQETRIQDLERQNEQLRARACLP
jgi:hypothetical protein